MKLWVIYKNNYENTIIPKTKQKTAKENGIDCKVFFFEYFSFMVQNGIQKLFYKSRELKTFPDVAFLMGYNTTIRVFLEKQGVKFVNSNTGAMTTKDKFKTHLATAQLGFTQPKTLCGTFDFDELKSRLSVPFVMKDRFGSRGDKVFLIDNQKQFKKIKESNKETEFIFQEFVSDSYGTDIRLYVVGTKVVGAIKRQSSNGDFRSNLSLGGKSELFFGVPLKIKKQAEQFAKQQKLNSCSVDFLISKKGWVFCEANANASFKAFFESGIDIKTIVMNYVKTLI